MNRLRVRLAKRLLRLNCRRVAGVVVDAAPMVAAAFAGLLILWWALARVTP